MLCEAMDSVAAQEFSDWEQLIIDDGSDDGTAAEVERRGEEDPRIRYIRRSGDRAGAGVCRNIGIRESRGEYVLFLDSDDLLEPGCLARRVSILDRNLDLDFITFQAGFFVDEMGDQNHHRVTDLLGDDLTRFMFFETPWVITGPLWRKATLMRIGLFDEALLSWQDVELHIRALTSGVLYLRYSDVDHNIRWQNKVRRISAEQRRSPRHLDAAVGIFEKIERLIEEGPGMTWIRRRSLCSMYFFVAHRWADLGQTAKALGTWRRIRARSIGGRFLHATGAILLASTALGVPCDRLINKWGGWMRLRTNAELVPRRSARS